MPKRSADDKISHYQRKIRKLEEKQNKRRLVRCSIQSSDEENPADTITAETAKAMFNDEPRQNRSPSPALEEVLLQPSLTEAPPPDAGLGPIAASSSETPPEPSLDPELLAALGASTSDTPDYGEPIHDSLANLWLPLLRKGLPKEEKLDLMKKYLVPSNCKYLQAPKLNAEILAATSDIVRGRDKKLEGFQMVLGAGASAINRAMDVLLKSDDKICALKSLSDGCRLLTDLHFSFSNDRRKLITPSLEKNFLLMIQDTERDETLFGSSLADKIKASKAIEKQGQEIRKRINQKPIPQPSVNRPAHQGNWTGPPRFSTFRGGRGGQRRPAPAGRRPYPMNATTSQAPPPPSKNFNQSKPRANTQQ